MPDKEKSNARQRRWLKRHGSLKGYVSKVEKKDKRFTVRALSPRTEGDQK